MKKQLLAETMAVACWIEDTANGNPNTYVSVGNWCEPNKNGAASTTAPASQVAANVSLMSANGKYHPLLQNWADTNTQSYVYGEALAAKTTSDGSQLVDSDYTNRANAQVELWFGDWNHRALLDHLTRVGIVGSKGAATYATVGDAPLG